MIYLWMLTQKYMLDFKNVEGLDAYSDEYKETMEINNKYLESLYF